jgi:hypothetical protein
VALEARLDEPDLVEVAQEGEQDAVRDGKGEDREDDDRRHLQIGDLGLEGVDAPGEDHRLDGLPGGDADIEPKDDGEVPAQRLRELVEPAD